MAKKYIKKSSESKAKFSLDANEKLVIRLENGTEIIIDNEKIVIDTELDVIVNSVSVNNDDDMRFHQN